MKNKIMKVTDFNRYITIFLVTFFWVELDRYYRFQLVLLNILDYDISYYLFMNYYQKKLQEKKNYLHVKPKDTSANLKKNKLHKMQHTKKNAQFGMF